jgi:hypothetical protein
VNAARRTRADLTGRKKVAEVVIDPDVRAAVGILIEHRVEPGRGGCGRYCVVQNEVTLVTQVQFDAVTEQDEDVVI